jgi:hypothetical protein
MVLLPEKLPQAIHLILKAGDMTMPNQWTIFVCRCKSRKRIYKRNNLNTRLKAYDANIGQILVQKNLSIQTLNKQITDQYIATYSSQQHL